MGRFMVFCILLTFFASTCHAKGMLYPQDSESRESKFLDGLWNFRADYSPSRDKGFIEKWWTQPLKTTGPVIDMPVPSSFNDVTENKSLRDFVGWVWYETTFYVSPSWKTKRVVLRFDSAHYNAIVWVNGKHLMEHSGGHLPFEEMTNQVIDFQGMNRLTVALNNTLSSVTLPPGKIIYEHNQKKYPPGYFVQELQMDFFNYGGIHRHVRLYTTPLSYIDDITLITDIDDDNGYVAYKIDVVGSNNGSNVVDIMDAAGKTIASKKNISGTLKIPYANLWWPYGMNESVGYMYTLQVNASGDIYRLPFGVRLVEVTGDSFLINNKKFYCLGLGKHEDSDLRGKGLDSVVITKDFNMLRWLGVNCFRTSHYPYAEEIMQLADRQGVAIIDESPGVGIKYEYSLDENGWVCLGTTAISDESEPLRSVFNWFWSSKSGSKFETTILRSNMGPTSLAHHLSVMGELVRRDKNHPCVIMWSVANEPGSELKPAVHYFKTVLQHTKDIDPAKRPVTFVSSKSFEIDLVIPYVDVICINRYYGWYHDTGHLEVIGLQLIREFEGFRNLYNKPIILTEYGADTIPGLHRVPTYIFTEDYQTELLIEYHKALDEVRSKYVVGEMVWNFADFMTAQDVRRVVGNKKGILTRQRQPKTAAYTIRQRYNAIHDGKNTRDLYRQDLKYTSNPHAYQYPLS